MSVFKAVSGSAAFVDAVLSAASCVTIRVLYVKDTPGRTWTLTVQLADPFFGPGQQAKAVLVLAPETPAVMLPMTTPERASQPAGR